MRPQPGDILRHTTYLSWATRVVAMVNRQWRARLPYQGEVLMTRAGLHSHLFRWACSEGLLSDPGPPDTPLYSAEVAKVFERDPEAIVRQARVYWKRLVAERKVSQQ